MIDDAIALKLNEQRIVKAALTTVYAFEDAFKIIHGLDDIDSKPSITTMNTFYAISRRFLETKGQNNK